MRLGDGGFRDLHDVTAVVAAHQVLCTAVNVDGRGRWWCAWVVVVVVVVVRVCVCVWWGMGVKASLRSGEPVTAKVLFT